jgi:hypothetical protein
MPDHEFPKLAEALGLSVPPAFWSAFEDLVALSRTSGFRRFMPAARFVRSLDEIRQARGAGLPEDLTPFLLEAQSTHVDCYCIAAPAAGLGVRIVVFAAHAIVAEWADGAAFLSWLEREAAQAPP